MSMRSHIAVNYAAFMHVVHAGLLGLCLICFMMHNASPCLQRP